MSDAAEGQAADTPKDEHAQADQGAAKTDAPETPKAEQTKDPAAEAAAEAKEDEKTQDAPASVSPGIARDSLSDPAQAPAPKSPQPAKDALKKETKPVKQARPPQSKGMNISIDSGSAPLPGVPILPGITTGGSGLVINSDKPATPADEPAEQTQAMTFSSARRKLTTETAEDAKDAKDKDDDA